ncbi:hypothetical protein AYO40_00635 [Planctomycetaceae bacterium SCGC AG-212-D15]|nr:hypothetical protein AYO40_00635 [Planctomycetaceae bacterium SCGC AG-212-D15]
MSRYETFDRDELDLRALSDRGHDVCAADCRLERPSQAYEHPDLGHLVAAIVTARQNRRPVILMMGGHPIKLGLSRYLIDLIERGFITHLATNGAGLIHDYELARVGGTSEDVAKWIKAGQFGLWHETGRLNEIMKIAMLEGDGLGEAVGCMIEQSSFPCRQLSITAAGARKGVPVTCHVSIGSDIIHAHRNCSGAALGITSYLDFLIFARSVQKLEGGVFLNVGSAVTGPEVYLKALSMARNVERQHGREVRHFTTAVFDLIDLPKSWRDGMPSKGHPLYYYRPWKTILVRTVEDGGKSYYFRGDHRQTIPTLWHLLVQAANVTQS